MGRTHNKHNSNSFPGYLLFACVIIDANARANSPRGGKDCSSRARCPGELRLGPGEPVAAPAGSQASVPVSGCSETQREWSWPGSRGGPGWLILMQKELNPWEPKNLIAQVAHAVPALGCITIECTTLSLLFFFGNDSKPHEASGP